MSRPESKDLRHIHYLHDTCSVPLRFLEIHSFQIHRRLGNDIETGYHWTGGDAGVTRLSIIIIFMPSTSWAK